MTKRSWLSDNLRCYFAATFLCFAVMNIGPARAQQTEMPRTAAQLEQLVAPIALYPDALLSQILMASTYPLEVVAAARWAQANSGVTGKALADCAHARWNSLSAQQQPPQRHAPLAQEQIRARTAHLLPRSSIPATTQRHEPLHGEDSHSLASIKNWPQQ
jgi:Protein of unknown function (DUF3300)